jgi:group I intron endonuclease
MTGRWYNLCMYVHYEIYLLTAPGYWYVGSTTIGARNRFKLHASGQGHAPILKAKIQELGWEAFSSTILEQDNGDPIEAEQRWYDWYLANDSRQTLNGKRPGSWGSGMKGKTHSPEARAKVSKAQQQIPHVGRPHTAEAKAKMSAARKGQVPWNKGRPHTAATRTKISASKKRR